MSLGPLDLTGGPFLVLYVGLLVCAAVASGVISAVLQPAGRRQDVHDAEELAVLTGGISRLAETVVTNLLANDALTMMGKDLYAPTSRATGASAAERLVLAAKLPASWSTIAQRLRPYGHGVERKLIAAGLLMDDEQTTRTRFWQTAPYLPLLCLGAAKVLVGLSRGRPVGYLTFLLIITVVLAVVRWRAIDRRTRSGRAAVFRARERSFRLRGAPTRAEAGVAVALFGTTVLAGSGLAAFHQARSATSSDGGSGGGDGGCGGGGGGCGGCGS